MEVPTRQSVKSLSSLTGQPNSSVLSKSKNKNKTTPLSVNPSASTTITTVKCNLSSRDVRRMIVVCPTRPKCKWLTIVWRSTLSKTCTNELANNHLSMSTGLAQVLKELQLQVNRDQLHHHLTILLTKAAASQNFASEWRTQLISDCMTSLASKLATSCSRMTGLNRNVQIFRSRSTTWNLATRQLNLTAQCLLRESPLWMAKKSATKRWMSSIRRWASSIRTRLSTSRPPDASGSRSTQLSHTKVSCPSSLSTRRTSKTTESPTSSASQTPMSSSPKRVSYPMRSLRKILWLSTVKSWKETSMNTMSIKARRASGLRAVGTEHYHQRRQRKGDLSSTTNKSRNDPLLISLVPFKTSSNAWSAMWLSTHQRRSSVH